MSFQDKIIKVLSQAKVRRQLSTVYLAAVLLPVLIISVVILSSFQSVMNRQYQNLVDSDNQRVKSILFNATTNLYNLSDNLVSNSELLQLLQTEYSSTYEAVSACNQFSGFQNLLRNETSVSRLCIYSMNHSLGSSQYIQQVDANIQQTQWFQKASAAPSAFWAAAKRTDQYKNVYWEVTLYRKITLVKSKSYAVLAISMNDNFLKNQIENNTLCSVLSVNNGPVFYSTWNGLAGTVPPVPVGSGIAKSTGRQVINGAPCLYTVSTLLPLYTNDQFCILSIDSNAITAMRNVTFTHILLLGFIIFISWLVFFIFTHYFSARVELLRSAMHRASNNDYDIVDSFHGDDEISETFHDLKILVQQVKQKEAEMYQEQIREQKLMNEQQEMEYKMLANQINPHFLYNTLETIRMKALTEGNRDVATAIKLLGKSMRYVLENTGTSSTTLQKELDYIDTYMKIQKLRFGDRINYSLSVAEDVHPGQCEILPLLLQPIAENAISHGLECTAGGGNIHIDIRLLGSSVLSVTITDNGTGISPEKLQALKDSLNLPCKTKTNSIGLYNINRRIRLCYGECYGLRLKSENGKGTQVNLTIPYTFTEEIKK